MFDFGKALVLLWYPARVLLVPSAYNNVNFCDVVGFFTSAFIEGADLAVLALAIHTALLIFRKFSGPEGGLYRYRYYVYAVNFLLPIVMASLAFVDNGRHSYSPLITWCYLPVKPVWYRLVLSWIPRYIILISIISIYVSIYFYVKLEYSKVVKDFKQSQTYIHQDSHSNHENIATGDKEKGPSNTTFLSWFTYPFTSFSSGSSDTTAVSPVGDCSSNNEQSSQKKTLSFKALSTTIFHSILRFISYFPGFSFLEPSRLFGISKTGNEMLDARSMAILEFQKDTMARFQARRNMIERQIRSIFVYPVAYVFLWIAPFAVHVLQFNYEIEHGPVFWIGAIAAFMQPFNCVVDTAAFAIRERPWVDREEKIFTKANGDWIKYHLWMLIPCAGVHRRNKYKKNQANSVDGSQNTAHESDTPNYSSNVFSTLDADLERFAGSSKNTKDGATTTESSFASNHWLVPSADPSKRGDGHTKQYTNHATNQSKKSVYDDPFSVTARRVEFDNIRDDASDDSDGSMDLMEFLR